jgi:hypothetical protein
VIWAAGLGHFLRKAYAAAAAAAGPQTLSVRAAWLGGGRQGGGRVRCNF